MEILPMTRKWSYEVSFTRGLPNCKCLCVLSDGSTDSGMTENELVCQFYLKNGKSPLNFLSVERAKNENGEWLYKRMTKTFEM